MRIVVCIKQILDYEISPKDFKINPETKEAERGRASLVIGPFDLNALEVALQLKERTGGEVTAVTLGTGEAKEALQRALAMGADRAVLIADPALSRPDATTTVKALAGAIRRLPGFDLVLCGRQDGDWDLGQVGPMLAEELGAACVPFAPAVEPAGDRIRVKREGEGGYLLVDCPLPAVVTVTNSDANQPRLPKVRDIMMARRKPTEQLTAADVGIEDPVSLRRVEVEELFIPETKRECEFVEGETGAEKGASLAKRLLELKVV